MVLKVIAFELGTKNSHNPKQDTCHWQSMCDKTPTRFNISLRVIFSKSGPLRVMKKYDKSALINILQEFWTLSHFDFHSLKRCFLESGLTKSFTACKFRNKVAMTIIFPVEMFRI